MRSNEAGHEAVEHTADLAVRAWAPDLRGLIEEAARGMLDLMLSGQPAPEEYVEVLGEGRDPEDLLVDCLREILALWAVDRRLPVSVEVTNLQEGRATCRTGIVGREVASEVLEQEIKAATYHGLQITQVEGGYEVTVVFDV